MSVKTNERVLRRALELACKYITIMEHDWENKNNLLHRKPCIPKVWICRATAEIKAKGDRK